MGIIDMFKFKENRNNNFKKENELNSTTLEALLNSDTEITRSIALDIPTVTGAINVISNLVAAMDIKLYKENDGKVIEISDDRNKLLNDENNDLISAYDVKKNVIIDYLIDGNGYIYINKNRNVVTSLHYISTAYITKIANTNPIFKDGKIYVCGTSYEPWEFITLLNNSKDGLSGEGGILKQNQSILSLAYNILKLQNNNMLTGGTKRGVLKSAKRLTTEAMNALKSAWQQLYSGKDSSSVLVLNEGMEFVELSQSATELQLLDISNKTNNDILGILGVSENILNGTATDEQFNNFVKVTIMPILKNFETAINKALLLEKEKEEGYYFAFDTKQLLKGDIEKRYKAYEIGIKNKILTVNDIRYEEDKEPIEAFNDIVVLGLNDVLYNTKTGTIYTPNTDKVSDMSLKGGDNIGSS